MTFPDSDGRVQNEMEQARLVGETQHIGGPKQDPKTSAREAGDRPEILAFVTGVVSGGLLGIVVAYLSDSVNVFQGIIVGVLLGALAGGLIGTWLKRRSAKKRYL